MKWGISGAEDMVVRCMGIVVRPVDVWGRPLAKKGYGVGISLGFGRTHKFRGPAF